MNLGFLQEANRLFFHPLGLALCTETDLHTGDCRLAGVWDYRKDPEGMAFGDDYLAAPEAVAKVKNVAGEWEVHAENRRRLFGDVIQEVG